MSTQQNNALEQVVKQVRLLKIYAIAISVLLGLFIFLAFKPDNSKQHFSEIEVERIDVVEKDGTLKMVISNNERQHPGMSQGKLLKNRDRGAGLIFFNSSGDECGGLVYDGTSKEAGMVFSVDQFRHDQVMQLQYMEDPAHKSTTRTYGLKLWDEPDAFPLEAQTRLFDSLEALHNDTLFRSAIKKLSADGLLAQERLFAGKTSNGDVGLFIRDTNGRPRVKIYVDKNNQVHLESLDAQGNVQPLK